MKQLGLITGLLFVVSAIGTFYWVNKTLGYLSGRVVSPGIAWSWVLLMVAWGATVYCMRKLARAQKGPARRELERDSPNFVVQMRRLG